MIVEELPGRLHDAAIELWHVAGLTRPWNDPRADLVRALGSPSATVLAALDERGGPELGGTVMVGHDGHRGWLYYLAAQPHRRGHGLGRRLTAAAETWLHGVVPKVQLMVRSENGAMARFYEHLGYEREDVIVLSRRLG